MQRLSCVVGCTETNVMSGRRGAAHVMIAMMLLTFAVMSAFMIDYGYMQLVRGQTRMVADAAARAGAEALIRTRDTNLARSAAVTIAGRNEVAGQPFVLDPNDVIFGQSVPQSDGTWSFIANVEPYNSVRVTPRVRSDAPFGAAPLFFGGVTGVDEFQTRSQATAGEQPVEICLCLDRSQSMIYQMVRGEVTPAGISAYPSEAFIVENTNPPKIYPTTPNVRSLNSPPHKDDSRWANMRKALNIFLAECGNAANTPRISLVTFSSKFEYKWKWSDTYAFPLKPSKSVLATTDDVPFHSVGTDWSVVNAAITTALDNIGKKPLAGSTQTQAGLQAAVDLLNGANSSVQSRKVIILFTDGIHDLNASPVLAGQNAAAAGITVHCVSLLTGFQSVLNEIAVSTGGKYYAPDVDASGNKQVAINQLQDAFRDLARQIPIVLME